MFDEGRKEWRDQKESSTKVAVIDFGLYLKSLVGDLIHYFGKRNISYSIECDEIYLSVNTAILFGLITKELITNALKHAFPDDEGGSIYIELKGKYGNHAVLVIRDTGIGFPKDLDFTNVPTFGLKLVNSYVKQLNGTIQLERDHGTTFTIEIPIVEVN